MLGAVLLGVAQLAAHAGRPRSLDRLRPDTVAAPREEELGGGGDDPPAVAYERLWMERPQRGERGRERGGITFERRVQVLDEVDLVDVAARDGRLGALDRACVALVVPGALPFTDREPSGGRRLLVEPADARGEERKPTRLGR